MVEDPLNSRFFRLGLAEYTFVSLLDGDTTIHGALSHLSTVMPNHRLTETDVAGLCRWLAEMDLAHTPESAHASRLAGTVETAEQKKALARWNPLMMRLPICRPDRAFAVLNEWIGWMFSPAAAVCWLVLIVIGGYRIGSQWDHFTASSQSIFAPHNWLWLAACWVILKIVHETSHGIVCKRYGGHVRETGVLFILFAPMAYVDVTSSWRFHSRWQRIHVAAAGMYTEILISAVAAIVWSQTGNGWLNNLCFNLIMMASVSTILFNANPLMKFDGYYMLSDGLGMPNLYVNGQMYLRYWMRKYLLGAATTLPEWPQGHAVLIRFYGWASFVWRMIVCLSLIVTAAALFQGAGMALAVLAGILWLGLPTYHFLKSALLGEPGMQPRRMRFALIMGTGLTVLALVLGFVPWPGSRQAPVVVEYSPHMVVRAGSSGFVREVHVESGQSVQLGQLLVILENRQLACDLADLELQIRQSEIRGRHHEQERNVAAQQAEVERCHALQSQLADLQSRVDRLTVRAPCAGNIIRRNLNTLLGTYLKDGDEILSLGDESNKELRLSIAQEDLDTFAQREGQTVCVDVPGHDLSHSLLEKVIPRATQSSPHPALAAVNGGPLPIKPVAENQRAATDETYELLNPRFTAVVGLSRADAQTLRTGQRAVVTCRTSSESVGQHLYNGACRWVRKQLAQ